MCISDFDSESSFESQKITFFDDSLNDIISKIVENIRYQKLAPN